jgi:hypothetical protein
MTAKTICAVLKVKNKIADIIRPFTVDDRPLIVLLEKHDDDFALSLLLLAAFIVVVVVVVVVVEVVVVVVVIDFRNLYLYLYFELFFILFCEKI